MATKYTYLPADKFAVYHQDDDVLHEIRVRLPEPPPENKIDGYGLSPKKQMFRRVEIPKRLKELEKSCVNIDEVWEKLNHYKTSYEEELAFIEREWDRRINGYWFFNHGKPTYIDGWHYFYLNYWKIDVGYPEYRDRDRRVFIFARYAYTTKEAYYPYRVVDAKSGRVLGYFSDEKEQKAFAVEKGEEWVRKEDGDFIIQTNSRTCYGVNYFKHRRAGATYIAGVINYCIITLKENAHGGIQSMDGDSAAKTFEKAIVKPWRKVPFFFKPRYAGSTRATKRLDFDIPGVRIGGKGSVVNIETGLESDITYAESAGRGAYDGWKLHYLNNDEFGKTKLEDVEARHRVQQKCLATGKDLFGFEFNTSTVGEMSKEGGKSAFLLAKYSMWDERNNTGQTESGLFNLFIPTYDGLEGFIDIFGNSIIEDPKERDIWRWKNPVRDATGRLMGAKRYLEDRIDKLLLRDDSDSIIAYEEEMRMHPTSFSQCFITAGSGSGFNLKKIVRRIKELRFDKSATRQGNFKWENGVEDTRVVWEDDDINGRFRVSLLLDEQHANQKIKTQGKNMYDEEVEVWAPLKPWKFTASADPYEFLKTRQKRASEGAGAVFMERDKSIDPDGKPVSEWKTYKIVCTYSQRLPNPYEYAEDMLMMSVYYGAMMYPEINLSIIWNHFVKRGYSGYLKYARDINGVWKKTPGFFNRGEAPQSLMRLTQNYIDHFIMLVDHIEILEQWKNLKGVEDLTNNDLTVAVGGALMGSETDYGQFFDKDEREDGDIDLSVLLTGR